MTTRIIKTIDDQASACAALGAITKLPITVTWTQGADRSKEQNALAFKWYKEIADQLGDRDAADVRAHCKLYIGVRMLVTENETFREKWHRLMKDRFSVEEKLEFMTEPPFPV